MRLMGATATGDGFKCTECGRTVRPHRGESPHFEHVERNPNCALSYG